MVLRATGRYRILAKLKTGVSLTTIGEEIAGINAHMDSIATSAREQSTGLSEINHAVNSMDQTMQSRASPEP